LWLKQEEGKIRFLPSTRIKKRNITKKLQVTLNLTLCHKYNQQPLPRHIRVHFSSFAREKERRLWQILLYVLLLQDAAAANMVFTSYLFVHRLIIMKEERD
jgi:hypothetical protein